MGDCREAKRGPELASLDKAQFESELPALQEALTSFRALMVQSSTGDWRFVEDEDQLRHDTLESLVADIEKLLGTARRDPTIPKQLKDLKQAVGARSMLRDDDAVDIINSLRVSHSQGMHESDEKDVVAEVGKIFRHHRVRDAENGQLYVAAAEWLGECGRRGAGELARALGLATFKSGYAGLRGKIILNLGRTRISNQKEIRLILEEARKTLDSAVLIAAGEALGYYTRAPSRTRRWIVGELLNIYESDFAKATTEQTFYRDEEGGVEPTQSPAQKTKTEQNRKRAQVTWNSTLSKLTGQDFKDKNGWVTWHKANPKWEHADDKDNRE